LWYLKAGIPFVFYIAHLKFYNMKSELAVEVLSLKRERLSKASVELYAGKRKVEVKFNNRTSKFETKPISPGVYVVKVSVTGMQSESREISIATGTHQETFVIGEKGLPFYYRGKVQIPFVPFDNKLAVSIKGSPKEGDAEITRLIKKLKLSVEKQQRNEPESNIRILNLHKKYSNEELRKVILLFQELRSVRHVGQLLEYTNEVLVFLSDEVIVKFKGSVEQKDAEQLLRRFNGQVLRTIPYLGNAYHVKLKGNATYELLTICTELMRTKLVEYAEPNVINKVIDFAVNPTDFLYASQWHIPLINLPDAWQALEDIDTDLTFGSPDVVLSVMDRGIVTSTTMGTVSAAHADFQPTLTDGSAKADVYFDFDDMVANNDTPPNDHGMGCAGVAGAAANNASVVAGENEGVVGAGANVKLMGVIRPAGGTETEYSDAFIWQAGFNPNSATAGFPAPLTRGADIITNSYGWGPWPISGLMTDAMNYVTTYGRNGKGTLMFFAAGNGNTNFRTQAGLSAHPRTFAIAASTDGDVRAWYSNFGDDIDICAPSNGGAQGIFSADLLNGGDQRGHTGGNLDYRSDFGGTSSATPLVAGVAALMLSVNPDLTWVEVRQILKDTAVKIDAGNTNAVGRWVDIMGRNSADPMYSGPFYSQWYGSGRIDAAAAVTGARDYDFSRDIVVRDNLSDMGTAPSTGSFWSGVDIWVRKIQDNVAPANYATHADTVHEQPDFGSACFLYVRYKNIGSGASYPFTIRAYITHWPGTEFIYPASFIPTVRPNGVIPSPLTPGTYLIGEASVTSAGAGVEGIVSIPWPSNLIPPENVVVSGSTVHWHPCILVEVTPHDGFTPTGVHVWENNNLAQKNLSINYDTSVSGDFAFAGIAGRARKVKSRFLGFELHIKWPVPRDTSLYIAFQNKYIEAYIEKLIIAQKIKDMKVGYVKDMRVFFLARKKIIRFNTPFVGYVPFIIGGSGKSLRVKDELIVDVVQKDDNGKQTGGLQFQVLGRKK